MEKQISKLKVQKNKPEEDMKRQASNSGEKWEEARDHMNETAAAINKAIGVFFKIPNKLDVVREKYATPILSHRVCPEI